ncbi:Serine/threonine-protein kinase 19 [Plasmodiophora brassicae]
MMMRRRKRARPAADAEQHRPLDDADTASMAVSDTLAAIHLLRNEFPFKGRTPPVVLKHHIYDVVYDRRQVEGELRSMAEANVCRLMRIGHDAEVGVVLTSDLIEFFNVKLETGRVTSATKSVMASFFDRVLPAHTGFFLERGHLIRDCFAGVDVEAGISILFAEGVIIRRDATSFWFSVPNAGEFAAQLAAGRQEMKSAVRRRGRSSRTESVAVLAAKPLKRSTLTAAYLVRDLVCLGAVRRVPAADGQGPLLEIVDNVP